MTVMRPPGTRTDSRRDRHDHMELNRLGHHQPFPRRG